MLAEYANITIDPVLAFDNHTTNGVGSFINGTWNGYLGELWNGNVDTITSFYQLTTKRAEFFTYSYPVYDVSIIYVARLRRRIFSDVIWNVFSSYDESLWIVLLIAFLLQVLVGTIIRRVEWKLEMIPKFDSQEKLWQYARLIVDQGDDRIPFETSSGNFAFVFYALFEIALFAGLYQGPMVTAAFQETNPSPIKSPLHFIKLIETKEYSIVTFDMQYKTFW
uniref:Uncharacterized protein n=1 Tax=Panagrolaimus sp. JU765 TaxID=591449 RepID=A0AC34RKY1_9BILA